MRDERVMDWTPEAFVPNRSHRRRRHGPSGTVVAWLRWSALLCAALLALTLLSNVVLWATMPRPLADFDHPPWVLGPNCSDEKMGTGEYIEKLKINPECQKGWEYDIFGKTYNKHTWPEWWWELS